MAGSFSQLIYHLVFSTKHREFSITPDLRPRLYDYLGGVIRGEGGVLYEIGGMPDHVHLLVGWKTDGTIADLLRDMKANSSKWVHDTFPAQKRFRWQAGYGAFTVSVSQREVVRQYIVGQEEHHRTKSFQDEFRQLLIAHEIKFDERYIWD